MKRICQYEFRTQELVTSHPPRLQNRNKRIVFEIASPAGATHSGTIRFSRWRPTGFSDTVTRDVTRPIFEQRDGFFTYDPSPSGRVDWHLNFAHYDLFCAYGGPLFAQDEMQVAEHPALASLRHGLLNAGLDPLTVEDGVPTPALIMGVERRCRVATDPNRAEGRPDGLYGNRFVRAAPDVVRRATQVIDPLTISNILAIEAPAGGAGWYTREDIEFVLATALTGFSAAVRESREKIAPDVQTAIHTGYWGCGAYGGNRVLMPLLQMIAACGSEPDTLVFHAGPDRAGYDEALALLDELLPAGREASVGGLLAQIESMEFEWGVSDGN